MVPAPSALALAAIALFACAHAVSATNMSEGMTFYKGSEKNLDPASLLSGCLFGNRWYTNGAVVETHSPCLQCTCANSTLACRRRPCLTLPDVMPTKCFIKRDSCCATLHCADEETQQQRVDEDMTEDSIFSSAEHNLVCTEEGITYAMGSAMPSNVDCENCFCLKGVKRCLRPSCVQAPPHCVPLEPEGMCCPQRYECKPHSHVRKDFDCKVDGVTVKEGEPVVSDNNCETCFCLKGKVQCQEKKCAPVIKNCEPLVRSGECCAHQYLCDRSRGGVAAALPFSNHTRLRSSNIKKHRESQMSVNVHDDADTYYAPTWRLTPREEELVSGHRAKTKILPENDLISATTLRAKNHLVYSHRHNTKLKPQDKDTDENLDEQSTDSEPTAKKLGHGHTEYIVRHPLLLLNSGENTSSNKVKRKIKEFEVPSTKKPFNDNGTIAVLSPSHFTEDKSLTSETTEMSTERTTEQPEGTVKIVINGTINCTAELSSTSLPLNINLNDTEKKQIEAMPRIPIINGVEAQTYSPNDIITDRSVNGDFDESDTFTINVTSSLNANTKLNANTTLRPAITAAAKVPVPVDLAETANSSKKTKGDYDYDYTEPTLPPSLPNLKIIPFVAADAVVDDETSKEPLTYPILEREDKFPVYYPNNPKDMFTKGEDIYHPTQYPVFISEKEPVYTHGIDLTSNRYSVQNDLMHDYTVSTSLGTKNVDETTITKAPVSSSTFEHETPAVNLFSPPIETEGGFIPKGPGIIDEYYAVYPSTPSGPHVPHLTTSMQLDISKGECLSDGGMHIPDGETVTIECRDCICSWGRLSCAPTVCQAPVGCDYMPVTEESIDRCCGDILCHTKNKNATTTSAPVTAKDKINGSKLEIAFDNVTTATDKVETSQTTKIPQTTLSVLPNTTKVIKMNNNEPIENRTRVPTTTPSIINATEAIKKNTQVNPITTAAAKSSTARPITKLTTTTSTPKQQANDTEYEDDEDEGFSFGSVLQLLLSDTYETTTTKKPKTSKPSTTTTQTVKTTTRSPPSTVSKFQPASTVNPFIPLPALPYFPPKISPSSVNRIDHLVLGEATAIKRTTPRPITNKTTKKPIEWHTERSDVDLALTSGPRPPNLSNSPGHGLISVGVGIFKLAGCNIYGRMYRVGRIIAELSTPCQECWCTELGVQCKPLEC